MLNLLVLGYFWGCQIKKFGSCLTEKNIDNFHATTYIQEYCIKIWINTYASDEFAQTINLGIRITNTYAKNTNKETLNKMNVAFKKGIQIRMDVLG